MPALWRNPVDPTVAVPEEKEEGMASVAALAAVVLATVVMLVRPAMTLVRSPVAGTPRRSQAQCSAARPRTPPSVAWHRAMCTNRDIQKICGFGLTGSSIGRVDGWQGRKGEGGGGGDGKLRTGWKRVQGASMPCGVVGPKNIARTGWFVRKKIELDQPVTIRSAHLHEPV